MASFEEHIQQANHNLNFLRHANQSSFDCWDWQVTVSFYVGVHLVNAHIARRSGMNYRSHEQVDAAINPYSLSITKLSEDDYLAYSKLQGLARRARYLIHEKRTNKTTDAQFTHSVHLSRAIKNLDILLTFMAREYNLTFPKLQVRCIDLNSSALTNFDVVK